MNDIKKYLAKDLLPALVNFSERETDSSDFQRDVDCDLRSHLVISKIIIRGDHNDLKSIMINLPVFSSELASAIDNLARTKTDSNIGDGIKYSSIEITKELQLVSELRGNNIFVQISNKKWKNLYKAYKSIDAIDMPVLDHVHAATMRDEMVKSNAQRYLFLVYHHQTKEVAKVLAHFRKLGLDLFVYIGIPYGKPSQEMAELLRQVSAERYLTLKRYKDGVYHVDEKRSGSDVPAKTDLIDKFSRGRFTEFDNAMLALAKFYLLEAVNCAKDSGQKILILEDGGKFYPIVHELLDDPHLNDELKEILRRDLVPIVEVTERGERNQRAVQHKRGSVALTGFSVARTAVKRTWEAFFVGVSVTFAGRAAFMQMTHQDILCLPWVVIGGRGASGRQLVAQIKRHVQHGHIPYIVDISPNFSEIKFPVRDYPLINKNYAAHTDAWRVGRDYKCAANLADALAHGCKVVMGISGENTIDPTQLSGFFQSPGDDYIVFISGSSSDIEFRNIKTLFDQLHYSANNLGFTEIWNIEVIGFRRQLDRTSNARAGVKYTIVRSDDAIKEIYMVGDGFPINFYWTPENGVPSQGIDPIMSMQYMTIVNLIRHFCSMSPSELPLEPGVNPNRIWLQQERWILDQLEHRESKL
jgi:hypothetical protein